MFRSSRPALSARSRTLESSNIRKNLQTRAIPNYLAVISCQFRQSVRTAARLDAVFRQTAADTGLAKVGVRRKDANHEVYGRRGEDTLAKTFPAQKSRRVLGESRLLGKVDAGLAAGLMIDGYPQR